MGGAIVMFKADDALQKENAFGGREVAEVRLGRTVHCYKRVHSSGGKGHWQAIL